MWRKPETSKNFIYNESERWLLKTEFSDLTNEQKVRVRKYLSKKCDDLSNEIPMNDSYRCISLKLYEELRNNTDNLILNKWVSKLNSIYTSPVVCIQTKNGFYVYLFVYKILSNMPKTSMYFLLIFHFMNCFKYSIVLQILHQVFNAKSIKILKVLITVKWHFRFGRTFDQKLENVKLF